MKVSLFDPVNRLYVTGTAIQLLIPTLSCLSDCIVYMYVHYIVCYSLLKIFCEKFLM